MIIVAQSSYTGIDIGLYNGETLLTSATLDKKDACAQLIPTIDALLHKEGLTLSDIAHIVVNKGPAPFSSLRTVIATINGISFASRIPLISVSAFEAINHIYNPKNTKKTFILFRAYSKEYYYAFYAPSAEPVIGIAALDSHLPISLTDDTIIIGHTDLIAQKINSLSTIPVDNATLEAVAQAGLYGLNKGVSCSHHITPLYIKTHF